MEYTGKITLGYVEFDITYTMDSDNSSDFFINLESIEFKGTNFYEVLYDQIEDIETKIKEQIKQPKND